MDVLARIDAAIAGACPCGADLQPGSAYCGDDCVPTYRAVDTTSDLDGTAMRWRPDLVSEVDDSRLTLINGFRRGPHHAQLFEIAGSDDVHYRLDDGNRFVGVDVNGRQGTAGLEPVWVRLERELGDGRHVEADPWADVMRRFVDIIDDLVLGPGRILPAGGTVIMMDNTRATFRPSDHNPVFVAAPVTFGRAMTRLYEGIELVAPVFTEHARRMSGFTAHLSEVGRSVQQLAQPDHPMLAAIERRRNRNTGPERRQRPPKQISPRH